LQDGARSNPTDSPARAAEGYVLDTRYEDRVQRELGPAWIAYAAALGGVTAPDLRAPFRYLELGCGPGGSLLAAATAFPRAEFHGCDLNGAHVAAARERAGALGLDNVHLREAAFADLLGDDIGAFDFIVAHGVYSWVEAPARADVRRLLATRLKPGGLAYLSYNCHPGWSAEAPLRRLLVELAGAAPGSSAERAAHAVAALQALSGAGLRYFRETPSAEAALAWATRQPPAYLAHEFLNAAWEVFYSADVAAQMAALGLRFAASATLADNYEPLLVGAEPARAIAALPTEAARALAMDFAVNRRFRRDVFSRDAVRLAPDQAARRLAGAMVAAPPRQPLRTALAAPVGEVRFQAPFVGALEAALAAGPATLGALMERLGEAAADRAALARNLAYYVALGGVSPCPPTGAGAAERG
jgi:SAM-dependent methyltransferase